MPVPKRKVSKSARGKRNANRFLKKTNYIIDSLTGLPRLSHHLVVNATRGAKSSFKNLRKKLNSNVNEQ